MLIWRVICAIIDARTGIKLQEGAARQFGYFYRRY